MDDAGDRTQKSASNLTILKSKVAKVVQKNSHDKLARLCYPLCSCLCKEKVRSLVVFPIW
jgi:hypothetical protein